MLSEQTGKVHPDESLHTSCVFGFVFFFFVSFFEHYLVPVELYQGKTSRRQQAICPKQAVSDYRYMSVRCLKQNCPAGSLPTASLQGFELI